MSFAIEVEEWAGSVWHKFITRKADPEFPEFRSSWSRYKTGWPCCFRAMGGGHEVSVEAAQARQMMVKRSFLQKVAGTARQLTVAWRDAQSVRLPPAIATYPEERLNLELYRWLTILSAHAGSMQHWGRDNQRWIAELMDQYPALQKRYTELVLAHLALRPESQKVCRRMKQSWKRPFVRHCSSPALWMSFPAASAPWPVALWLYPPLNLGNPQQTHWDEEDGDM